MKRMLAVLLMILFMFSTAHAQRWFKATALDTEGYESGFSNAVVLEEFVNSVTLAWDPNTEDDILGYRIWINCADEPGYMPIQIDIYHLDYCTDTECQITLDLNNPTIIVGGGVP